jgi:hypothetical protein
MMLAVVLSHRYGLIERRTPAMQMNTASAATMIQYPASKVCVGE